MRSISSLPRGKTIWARRRLKLPLLYSTQTVRAAPRDGQAAAEVRLDSDEETEHDGNTDENPSKNCCELLGREVKMG